MFFIESERLKMTPLTHTLLQLMHTDRPAMEQALGLNISSQQIDELFIREIKYVTINFWLPKTLENAAAYKWYTNWEIILKSENTSIGGMGFAGEANENGEAETGYLIDEQHQNRGYATEALQLLSRWAFTHDHVKAIIVHTFEDNLPSRKLLSKSGFEEIDKDENGLMTFRLKRPATELPDRPVNSI